jgi:hypothetical protein
VKFNNYNFIEAPALWESNGQSENIIFQKDGDNNGY